jgi:CHAT domain-containing protein
MREDTLRSLDERGELRRYRTLHFATHGIVVPDAPAQSALILSGAVTPRPDTMGVDGYLTMDEIAALRLDAEFVALSACQTGLGRIYRGTGVVSLAQAFLRAGADATTVSLWSVYDASTHVFMEALYRRVWTQGQSWDTALAETKRAFVNGAYGDRLRDPRFWAPFVYYGRGGT